MKIVWADSFTKQREIKNGKAEGGKAPPVSKREAGVRGGTQLHHFH